MRTPRERPTFTPRVVGDSLGELPALHAPALASQVVDDHILAHRCRIEYTRIGEANPRDGTANDRWRASHEPAFREAQRAKMHGDAERMAWRRSLIEAGKHRLVWIATAEVNRFDAVSQ